MASALAGLLAVAFLPSKEINNTDASQVASRAGMRTGYISASVASGATLLLSVWGALRASSAQTDLTLGFAFGGSSFDIGAGGFVVGL